MSIEFWVSIGSTYSYLSVARLAAVERAHGVRFTLHPFNVREIMIEQQNLPFSGKPVKTAYMWRDLERRAARHGLALKMPVPYPLENLPFANQVAMVAAEEGWLRDYLVVTYRLWMAEGLPAGEDENLSRCLAELGQDATRVRRLAAGPQGVAALAEATWQARRRGIFGSPSFLVGDELFWGDDRMEDAVEWFRDRHRL